MDCQAKSCWSVGSVSQGHISIKVAACDGLTVLTGGLEAKRQHSVNVAGSEGLGPGKVADGSSNGTHWVGTAHAVGLTQAEGDGTKGHGCLGS